MRVNGAVRPVSAAWLPQALVLLPLGGLLLWWAFDDGGYAPLDWEPAAVGLLALSAIVACSPVLRRRRRPTRRLCVALAAFGLYTAWSYTSVAWAGDPGTALEGAHRSLLYLAALAVVGLAAPPPSVVRGAALVVAGIAGLAAVVTVVRLAGTDTGAGLFADGRLYWPLGYFNANAAFWTTGALIGAGAGSMRDTPPWARPVLLGLAATEVGLAVLAASRGWLFTLPFVLVATLVLVPARLRLVPAVAALGAVTVPGLGRLLGPVDAVSPVAASEAIDAVVMPLVAAGAVAAALGFGWVLLDRRVVVPTAVARRIARAGAVLAAVTAVGGAAVALVVVQDPRSRVERAWDEFKANDTSTQFGASRLTAAGSSRYDFWRVSVDLVKKHPLAGIGQDNFAVPYVARRSIDYEEPRWVHSLPLRTLVHTGIVGALLLGAALVALFAGAVGRRDEAPEDRAAASLALLPLVVWTLHGSVDWFWEYPILSVTALGLAAAAGSTRRAAAVADPVPQVAQPVGASASAWPARLSLAGRVALVGLAAAGMVAVGCAYVAGRDVELASKHWPADPPRAFERLDQAASLSPSAQPYLVEGLIALRRGDLGRARRAFADAADRNPGDWFARFELGMVAVTAGDRKAAAAAFADAARRNPKDTILKTVRQKLAGGETFTVADVDQLFAQRASRFSGN